MSEDENTKKIVELEKKLNLELEIRKLTTTSITSLENRDKEHDNKIEKLEKILLLPDNDDWISGMRRKYNNLEKEISELKEYYNIEKNVANETDFDWKVAIIDRIIKSEEVLREHYKEHLYLGELQKTPECTADGLLSYWDNALKEGLKKLDGKDGENLSSKCPDCGNILLRSGAKGYFICRSCESNKSTPSKCTLKEQMECDEEGSLDCIPEKSTCIHGKIYKEKEPTTSESNICVNCGRLNDMGGVYLRNINLCDGCIAIIMGIVTEKDWVIKEKEPTPPELKCDGCDLVAYSQCDKEHKVCLHESFYPQAPRITEDFKCPKVPTPSIELLEIQKEVEKKHKNDWKKEPTDDWMVIIVNRKCPHKLPEMKDYKWFYRCELTKKICNIENCTKKYMEDEP